MLPQSYTPPQPGQQAPQQAQSPFVTGGESGSASSVPQTVQSKLQRLHKALYDAQPEAPQTVAQALSMLNRMRRDIGLQLVGSGTAPALEQGCDEAIETVGC